MGKDALVKKDKLVVVALHSLGIKQRLQGHSLCGSHSVLLLQCMSSRRQYRNERARQCSSKPSWRRQRPDLVC